MPEKETLRRARADKRAGKSASTQAGEFVREEVHHVREGKHGARSTKQAIAIGMSKARRAKGRPYQTAAGHDAPAPRDGIVRCDAATAALTPWTLIRQASYHGDLARTSRPIIRAYAVSVRAIKGGEPC